MRRGEDYKDSFFRSSRYSVGEHSEEQNKAKKIQKIHTIEYYIKCFRVVVVFFSHSCKKQKELEQMTIL